MSTSGVTGYPATLVSVSYDSSGAAISIPLPSVCSSPADVPWLSVDLSSGSVDAGQSVDVVIEVDASGLSQGQRHEATICVQSNDPVRPVVEVPVVMDVVEAAPLEPEIFKDGFESE